MLKKTLTLAILIVLLIIISSCMSPEYEHLKNGDNYSDQQKWVEAIAEYTKAIEVAPKLAEAYNNRASAYTEKGDYEKAIADCTKVIAMDPESVVAYYNRSIAYLYNRQYEKAVNDCEKILELGLNSPWVYYHRGMAYIGMGEYRGALSSFIQAKKISTSPEFTQMIDQQINSIQGLMNQQQNPQ
jgi:tetratricopeptide (TPR) repeat protein